MRTLAIELGPAGIRVNTIHPGAVDTPMGHDSDVPRIIDESPRLTVGLPGTAAARRRRPDSPTTSPTPLLWISSDEARFVTGVTLPVDGGSLVR